MFVELTALFQVVKQSSDLVVGVAEEASETSAIRAKQALLLVRSDPRGEPVRSGQGFRSCWSIDVGLIGEESACSERAHRCCVAGRPAPIRLVAHVELPRYLSDHSVGAWCGAWQAPGQ